MCLILRACLRACLRAGAGESAAPAGVAALLDQLSQGPGLAALLTRCLASAPSAGLLSTLKTLLAAVYIEAGAYALSGLWPAAPQVQLDQLAAAAAMKQVRCAARRMAPHHTAGQA